MLLPAIARQREVEVKTIHIESKDVHIDRLGSGYTDRTYYVYARNGRTGTPEVYRKIEAGHTYEVEIYGQKELYSVY